MLWQANDLRECPITQYEAGTTDDIRFYREPADFLAWLRDVEAWGAEQKVVPVVCGFNLLFDLQSTFAAICDEWGVEVAAQSTTNVYYVDLTREGRRTLRLWDAFHLDPTSLAHMGETAGLPKLSGDWDYDLARTPETGLTQEEAGYASRDVQVIPAYLRWLCESNADWLTPDMLGCKVITKTSLVRQMAARKIAKLEYPSAKRGRHTLGQAFMATCAAAMPGCYYDYGLRKACFRGGFTFTSARYACVVVHDVLSLDVTSMHHTFINGRKIPEQFRPCAPAILQDIAERVVSTSVEDVLKRYEQPFEWAFHARFRFRGLRLRKGSAFEAWGIALAPRGKFGLSVAAGADFSISQAAQETERAAKLSGWRDSAKGARFAFGKLYEADAAIMHLSELELWAMAQVYEWDSIEALFGEATGKWQLPPDYVTLQSNVLFERKQDMKRVLKLYEEGRPYPEDVPKSIPAAIAAELRAGTADAGFLESYYRVGVKGAFNSIYGTQAQDVYKCEYDVSEDEAIIEVNHATVATPANFSERTPEHPKVLYTYGLRIVGGSRIHLVIALMLLWQAFGERVAVTGGDTDSVKMAVLDSAISDEDVARALNPLAEASDVAISRCMRRVRENHPELASDLRGIGSFDVENAGARYVAHCEYWNKCRVSVDKENRAHVTCAGLSRPKGARWNMETFLEDYASRHGWDKALTQAFGYETIVSPEVAHSLQRNRPSPRDVYEGDVTDWRGATAHVRRTEAVALWPVGRELGSLDMRANAESVAYMRERYGREVACDPRSLEIRDGRAEVVYL